MPSPGAAKRRSAATRVMWLIIAFGFGGYFATVLTGNPVLAMGLATGSAIFLGARAATPLRGALRGAFYGAIAGAAMASGVHAFYNARAEMAYRASTQPAREPSTASAPAPVGPNSASRPAPATAPTTGPTTAPTTRPVRWPELNLVPLYALCMGGTTGLSATVGLLFAVLARRRRRLIDEQWDRQG